MNTNPCLVFCFFVFCQPTELFLRQQQALKRTKPAKKMTNCLSQWPLGDGKQMAQGDSFQALPRLVVVVFSSVGRQTWGVVVA